MPHYTQKVSKCVKIDLIKKRTTVSYFRMMKFVDLFKRFFASNVSNLTIPAIEYLNPNLQNSDPIVAIDNSYEKQPNIEKNEKQVMQLNVQFQKN